MGSLRQPSVANFKTKHVLFLVTAQCKLLALFKSNLIYTSNNEIT